MDRLHEWASKPRVRLVPFYYAKSPDNPEIKNYRAHIKEQNLATFPRYQIEDNFYEIIKQEPQFCCVRIRYLAGYFACQTDGIEEPNADVVAMWEVKKKGGHIQTVYIFYVDDQYYAGDIVHDQRPQWVIKPRKRQAGDHEFYIRLLYKIRESTNPDGTGPRINRPGD